jgi:undecaprenyl-diphosphatase
VDNVIIFCAKYLVIAVPLIVSYVWLKQPKSHRLELMAAGVISVGLALTLHALLGMLYDNPRPFLSDGTPALVGHGDDNGFPSQHTIMAMSLVAVVYFYNRRLAVVALIITILVGWGRVAAHVHHGVDIIAGLAAGALAGWAGYWVAKRLLKPSDKHTAVDKQTGQK